TKDSSAPTAIWMSTSRTTRSSTLTAEVVVVSVAACVAVLPVLCLSARSVAERIAGKSFQLSRCLASSLFSLSRAFSASSEIEEPIKANRLYMRRQILGGGRVIGRRLYNRQATHRHSREVS